MENKVVLITGCSSGFGKKLCEVLSNRNYYVIATARNRKTLDTVPAKLKLALDVSSEESIQQAMASIQEKTGQIDILINNAGYSVRSAMEELSIDTLQNMYQVNVFGLLRMTQAVLPLMREQGHGRIFNIGSISGRMVSMVNGGYCSSKYAVEAITEATRGEVSAYGIEVCVIEPGAMETDFFKTLARNSDATFRNTDSPYHKLYDQNITFQTKQARADITACATRLANILEKRRLKTRYTIGVSLIYKLFIHMPDNMKEFIIRRF